MGVAWTQAASVFGEPPRERLRMFTQIVHRHRKEDIRVETIRMTHPGDAIPKYAATNKSP